MPPPPPQTAAPVLERRFATTPDGRCRIRVPRAVVTLTAGADDEAVVALTAAEDASPEAARALADELRIRHAGGVLRVEPEHSAHLDTPDWRALREGVPVLHLRVRVPAAYGADVHASGGVIDARDLRGSLTLEATGGSIRTAHLSGRLDVRARRCETTIEHFSGEKCSAHVHGGQLTVRNVTADTVEVEGSDAPLQFEDIEANLSLIAHSGSTQIIDLHGALDAQAHGSPCSLAPVEGHPFSLRAPGGDVRLTLSDSLAADLHLSAHRLGVDALPNTFKGERTPHRAEGALAGGGPRVTVTAPGGTVRCE